MRLRKPKQSLANEELVDALIRLRNVIDQNLSAFAANDNETDDLDEELDDEDEAEDDDETDESEFEED